MRLGPFLISSPAILLMPAAMASAQTLPASIDASQPATTSQPATSQPVIMPSTAPATADVSPAAAPLLAKLAAAYAQKGPRAFAGTVQGDFDVAGRSKTYLLDITGRTDGNGRFWHYTVMGAETRPGTQAGNISGQGVGLLVSDGATAYLYDQHRNAYAELQTAAGRAEPDNLDSAISDVLIDENPALLLTLTTDPDALLRRLAKSIGVSNSNASSLVLELHTKKMTLQLDEKSLMIIQSTIDYAPLMQARGAVGVKRAQAVLHYDRQVSWAKTGFDNFTWLPPATASQITLQSEPLRPTTQKPKPQLPPKK